MHTFKIIASHQYSIPEDMYTLLGTNPVSSMDHTHLGQYWVVGRLSDNRARYKICEKVSVFHMTDSKEIEQLNELVVKSHFILT